MAAGRQNSSSSGSLPEIREAPLLPPKGSLSEGSCKYRPQGFDPDTRLPVVYCPAYNITFFGLERVHPFDSSKWGKVFSYLKQGFLTDKNYYQPKEITEQELLTVHSASYLSKLRWSAYVSTITEVPIMAVLPNCMVQRRVLKPFRFQTAGTILASELALEYGWAIHLGGGFHHASAERGGGFCCYADITLAVRTLTKKGCIKKAMIVDLDAHQGNGHERDFIHDPNVYIMDVYNRYIYPGDEAAKAAIKRKVELRPGTGDELYLRLVSENLSRSLAEFTPELTIYNAGTDILEGDVLGRLNITDHGIVKRDELVFTEMRNRGIPVVMVTSGGYQRRTAGVIAQSILHLAKKGLLYSKKSLQVAGTSSS
ncbi:histone deacetylase 11-like isoform X2 [Ornithodoros turicata]|uniref:histone deacetylase 11-like isoform X2 n=1 Tax=Ornithodoros turicata TaxID=34597 RepID=UPI003139AE6E